MHKVSRRQKLMLTLPGLMLLAAFFIGSGVEAINGNLPVASAANAESSMEMHSKASECAGEQRKPSFGSAVVVSSGEVVCGDLISFGGEVVIRGEVNGDVVAFAGNVVVDGAVNGAVTLYGGNFTSQNGAHINGDVHVCGGRWTREADSQLYGSIIGCTRGVDLLLGNDGGVTFRFWSALTWVVLGILLTKL
ncbi:MAG: polymer-forming cytoskeletal protein, partial [Ktedonobacteraceae bacterium]|nr:polymer-forming cytoskeletal protein [Ktedonobacteraceae bacterium]